MRGRGAPRQGDVEDNMSYDDDVSFKGKSGGGRRVRASVVYLGLAAASLVWLASTAPRSGARYGGIVASCCGGGLLFSHALWRWISRRPGGDAAMRAISNPIANGAAGFLRVQYRAVSKMAAVLCVAIGASYQLRPDGAGAAAEVGRGAAGFITSACFVVGAAASALSGYCAMRVAAFSNVRVADAAKRSAADALVVCFRGGAFSAVLNLTLCIVGVLVLFGVIHAAGVVDDAADVPLLLVGYGFGASFVALFMQLGGGIYTKAADVGADLVGKVEQAIPEDDPRNPAVVADLVGDMVGDCVGSSADVFESVGAEIIGAMILGGRLARDAGADPAPVVFFPH